jgi:starvation-inducible DNA-binding protein
LKIEIGLSDQDLDAEIRLLNKLLADEFVLYTKTRNYHWNVVGPQFSELHSLFQTQYEQLNGVVDEVAERCRTLGGNALGTLEELKQQATLPERPGVYPDAAGMLADLLTDYEALIRSLRTDAETTASTYHDAGTSGFLTGLMEQHEKTAWMLRSLLGK